MRTFIATIVLLAVGLGAARAQVPLPFDPEPDLSRHPQCTRDYVRSVEQQAAALEKLRTAGPEAVGQVCTLIEVGSAWLGGDLPDDVRRELRGLLGFDVDLKQITAQCRTGQGKLERELAMKLRQLKFELLRCDNTV
ncbi:MAG TPA: hypothetical protein VG758_14190 [Hyphomicrobiaceae bacterium]|jgi:hypothetical protein|nr:hypothetical protein [Hyphomicrobiaceae bacterium]